ncbi:MAG: PD40 domain-containing protein [Anaerolineae bacterium]|nr:PD40 domain-containing protein [Anaerolineae bacterium]
MASADTQLQSARLHIPHFDRVILAVIVVLIGLILLVISMGDRVGVIVHRVVPEGIARSTSPIIIEFSEPMNRESVAARFSTAPNMDGDITWNGSTFIFKPVEAIAPGENVSVLLEKGASSASGRELLHNISFDFTVRTPHVAYLFPANDAPSNIWVADPNNPESAQQLTFSPSGIYDFSVSPDGSMIAFSENNSETGTQDLKLLDLETGGLEQITNCVDSACTNPVWRPDGQMIAYERVELNSDMAQQGVGISPTRVWTLDLSRRPVETRPLFSDLQRLGHSPQWSADGSRIAVYDSAMGAILLYDFTDGSLEAVPSRAGSSGALSPDGTALLYPEIVLTEGAMTHSYLRMVILDDNQVIPITDPPQSTDDARAAWRPDGQQIAVSRRDESLIRGYQIYLLDPENFDARMITDDPRYTNMFFLWDPTGQSLVIHRFPELDENMQPNMNGLPEIWTLNTLTGELIQVAQNAWMPRWLP